jgi:hypothetical protein
MAPYITLQTDNQPAANMFTKDAFDTLAFKFQRYRIYLQNFRARVYFVAKKGVVLADTLSRQPYLFEPRTTNGIGQIVTDKHLETAVAEQRDVIIAATNIHFDKAGFFKEISKAQQVNKVLQPLIKQLQENGNQPIKKGTGDYFLGAAGTLMRRSADRFTTHEQLVIPDTPIQLRETCLKQAHAGLTGAHMGTDGTYQHLLREFHWPGMQHDVEQFVKHCDPCQRAKASLPQIAKPFKHRLVSDLFDLISVDLLIMSIPSGQYRNILVVQDYFSKFLLLIPLKSKDGHEALRAIHDRVFGLFGAPNTILSDNGTEFKNSLMQLLKRQYDCDHIVTPPHHPQANAANERSHAQIMNSIRILAERDRTHWASTLGQIQYAINTTPKLNTSITPYDIVFARKPKTILQKPPPPFDPRHEQDIHLWGRDLREAWQTLLTEKAPNTESAFLKTPQYQPGDLVLVVNDYSITPRNKSDMRADGPYTILRELKNGASYELKHLTTNHILEAATRRLKRYAEPLTFSRRKQPTSVPPPTTSGGATPSGGDITVAIPPTTTIALAIGGESTVLHNAQGDTTTHKPVLNEMIIAAANRDRTKLLVGRIDEHTEGKQSFMIRVYCPRSTADDVQNWRFSPTYEHKKTGELRAHDRQRDSNYVELTWSINIEDVLTTFRQLEGDSKIPAHTLQSLKQVLPNGIHLEDALAWLHDIRS